MAKAKEDEIIEQGSTQDIPKHQKNDSLGQKWKEFKVKAKETAQNVKQKVRERTDMEGILKQANISLKAFLNPKLDIEKKIPADLFKECKGIVFLTVAKASFGVGGSVGAGIVMKHNNVYGWSYPCAIGAVGLQWGWNLGAQKTDHIIILRDDNAMKTFTSRGNLKFGGDAAISVGKTGRNANVAVGINEKGKYAAIVSYSMSKGAYIGVALEGQGISLRSDCNQRFYDPNKQFKNKVKYNADAIFSGDYFQMPFNNDYNEICNLLNEYLKQISSNNSEIDDEMKENNQLIMKPTAPPL